MDKLLVPLLLAGLALALILLLFQSSPLERASPSILIQDASGSFEVAKLRVPAQLELGGEEAGSVIASDGAGVWSGGLEHPDELARLAGSSPPSVLAEHAAGLFGGSLDASFAAARAADGGALVLSEHAVGTSASALRAPSAGFAKEAGKVPGLVLVEHAAGAFGKSMSLPIESTEAIPPPDASGPRPGEQTGILIDGADGLQGQRLLPASPAIKSSGTAETGGNP